MAKVELADEEWRTLLIVLQETPGIPLPVRVVHELTMKIAEQVRKQANLTVVNKRQ